MISEGFCVKIKIKNINYQYNMEKNKYAESDKKCCQWLDELMGEKYITTEKKKLFSLIKSMLIEFPKEELEPLRGKYLVFIKDESNKYKLHNYVFDNCLDVTEYGITDAYLFLVPTEHFHCSTARMPHRNAIDSQSQNRYCIIS